MTDDPKKKDPARGIPLGQWSGSDATNTLHDTIRQFTEQSARQTRTLIRLTWAIVGLTVAMVLGLIVQIWLAW
jgi:hypothetical protein